MARSLEPELDLPIPGMGLTHELGARPWQSPPQYATVEDALDFYLSRIGDDKYTISFICSRKWSGFNYYSRNIDFSRSYGR